MANINIEKLLNIFNYFDGVIITDEHGKIQYYTNFRTDVYNIRVNDLVGKTILEIHPYMKEEDSTIMRVLKTGKPVFDHVEHLRSPHGDTITNLCSTLPIFQGGNLVGAIDYSRCIDDGVHINVERRQITLPTIHDDRQTMYHADDIITTSRKLKEVKSMLPMIANTDSAVMIYGETGTGKEMFAQSIHAAGSRGRKTFVSQNCAAIPETLLEVILFGTEKGSYTDAMDKPGLFELADGGTLFLDEINSMPMSMQAKILKAIEEKRARRVGGSEPINFDVKIISALNKDPVLCIKEDELREDLFYRLGTVLIEIPPLRERKADIPLLAGNLISKFNLRMNKKIMGLSDEVIEIFNNYSWPGNVRELRNVIEGAFNVIGSEVIRKSDLPSYMTNRFEPEHTAIMEIDDSLSLIEKVDAFEKNNIITALDCSKTVSEAAEKLKISKQALNYKMLKYSLKSKK